MISIENLLKERLPANYYAPDVYVQGDFELGLLENRSGVRLIALPEILLEAIYTGLADEVGSSAGMVLFQCGRWWGKSFYRRFAKEVSEYYGKPLAEMEMVEFLQSLKQCWKTHGWGVLDLDLDYYERGFLVAKVWNSAFPQAGPKIDKPMCFTEAGILSALFSQITGRELHCIQTSCESMGAESNHFVLGLAERIQPAEAWLEEGQDHDTIMMRLCQNKTAIESKED